MRDYRGNCSILAANEEGANTFFPMLFKTDKPLEEFVSASLFPVVDFVVAVRVADSSIAQNLARDERE